MGEPIIMDLAGAMLSQSLLDRVHGLCQLEHDLITLTIKNISSTHFPRLIVDYGDLALAQVVVGALEFEKRLQSVELALRLRTDQV